MDYRQLTEDDAARHYLTEGRRRGLHSFVGTLPRMPGRCNHLYIAGTNLRRCHLTPTAGAEPCCGLHRRFRNLTIANVRAAEARTYERYDALVCRKALSTIFYWLPRHSQQLIVHGHHSFFRQPLTLPPQPQPPSPPPPQPQPQPPLQPPLTAELNECECTICFDTEDDGSNSYVIPVCGHPLHTACFTQWKEHNRSECPLCPTCREPLRIRRRDVYRAPVDPVERVLRESLSIKTLQDLNDDALQTAIRRSLENFS